MKQMSANDRLKRKNYMGVWRFESELTAIMMRRSPNTVIRYMIRNIPKRMGCSSGSSESPMRWNSETPARFLASMMLGQLLRKKIH
jgi:hypothetical protein